MPTVLDNLLTVMKVDPPEPGESFEDFAYRLTKKVNNLQSPKDDAIWNQLSEEAQNWYNVAILQVVERRSLRKDGKQDEAEAVAIAELDGFEAVPATEAAPVKRSAPKRSAPKKAKPVAEAPKPAKEVKPAKAAKAPKVKAKPAKAAPKAKAKAVGKRGRRSVFSDDAKLKLLVKENPYRAGTAWHRRWPKYKNNITVGEVLKNGSVGRNHLRYSVAKGHISIG